jgi:hypothetical protein
MHVAGSMENAYSNVVSSYTPSIKALFHARQQAARAEKYRTVRDPVLIAAMPTTPKDAAANRTPSALPGDFTEKDEIV